VRNHRPLRNHCHINSRAEREPARTTVIGYVLQIVYKICWFGPRCTSSLERA
jgi:hypothetical protein